MAKNIGMLSSPWFGDYLDKKSYGKLNSLDTPYLAKLTQGQGFTIEDPTSFRNVSVKQKRNEKGQFTKGYDETSAPEIANGFVNNRKEKTFGVSSTAIQSARYDPSDNSLNITYKGGDKEYKFAANPEDVVDWAKAPSKGRITQAWRESHRYPGY